MTFSRADRTYYVSDERLAAFAKLTVAERLQWVEELALFLRLAQKRSESETGGDTTRLTQRKVHPAG